MLRASLLGAGPVPSIATTAALLFTFVHACGGNVVAGAGGSSGSGGASSSTVMTGMAGASTTDGGPGSECLPYGGGPVNPNSCTDGATCYEGGTICEFTWTCQGGKWHETMMCAPGDSTASSSGG